ncbi:MAG TPA: elongation factor Ts [Candidatus Paceibacterota bacterium]|nr:elongation factor Ts [Candidatus Paceibacterota bacterium]HMP19068.1 elongation factor Ts [Candidatus Paceibacterota bacterium]HMP85418.1 elongation factor Ts [Candidatus Paceibacterota bacterium]
MITTDQIKALREETQVSVMQCKKALEEAGGDMEKAKQILQEKSASAAAKKSDRSLGAGTVATYVHAGGNIASMVELLSETDFVSKNEDFKSLAREIAVQVVATNPKFVKPEDVAGLEVSPDDVEQILLNQIYFKNPEITIKGLIDQASQKFGEKIEIGRISRFAVLE